MENKILTKNGKVLVSDRKVLVTPTSNNIGGFPIELSTPEEMEAVLVAENIGKIYKYVGETNETFTNGNLYQVTEVE